MLAMSSTYLLLAASLFHAAVKAQCFFADGSPYQGAVVCDASTSDGQSGCCGIEDECTTNGFCKWQGFRNNNILSVSGCTDRNWTSSNCAQQCRTDPSTGIKHSNNQFVFACTQTTYCCSPYPGVLPGGYIGRPSNYSCCNDPSQVFDAGPANYLALRKDFTTSLFSATATATSTRSTGAPTDSSAANSASNTGSSSSSASSSDQLSAGAKAGIGIGAALVGVIAIALAAWLVLKHRGQKKASSPPLLSHNGSDERNPPMGTYEGSAWQAQGQGQKSDAAGFAPTPELGPGSQVGRSELGDDGRRRELP